MKKRDALPPKKKPILKKDSIITPKGMLNQNDMPDKLINSPS